MTPSLVISLAGNYPTTTATATGVTIPAAGVAVGDLLCVFGGSLSTANAPTTVTDTQSNIYRRVSVSNLAAAGSSCAIFISRIRTALVNPNSVTITMGTTSTNRFGVLIVFRGVTNESSWGTTDVGQTTASTTWTAGPLTLPDGSFNGETTGLLFHGIVGNSSTATSGLTSSQMTLAQTSEAAIGTVGRVETAYGFAPTGSPVSSQITAGSAARTSCMAFMLGDYFRGHADTYAAPQRGEVTQRQYARQVRARW